jgi:cysteine desulfurase / selenocysteine lyase
VLGYEHGIGVRSGCFCAQPYIAHLLGVGADAQRRWLDGARRGDARGAPGMVRISFGCHNDTRDVDLAVAALRRVVAGDVAGDYREIDDGTFAPEGYVEPALFTLGGDAERRRGWARAGTTGGADGVGGVGPLPLVPVGTA